MSDRLIDILLCTDFDEVQGQNEEEVSEFDEKEFEDNLEWKTVTGSKTNYINDLKGFFYHLMIHAC